MRDIWSELESHWYVNLDSNVVVSIAPGARGALLTLFETKQEALKTVVRPEQVQRVNSVWTVAMEAAKHGMAGLVSPKLETRFDLVCRIEDIAHDQPTGLRLDSNGSIEVWTPYGLSPHPNEYLPWGRFDLLDRSLSSFPPDAGPFGEWQSGMPLFEIVSGSAIPMFGDLEIEGPFPAHFGAFAVFTTLQAAEECCRQHLSAGKAVAFHHRLGEPPDPEARGFTIRKLSDLLERSLTLAKFRPGTRIWFNPLAERPFAGVIECGSDIVRTAAGLWRLSTGNIVTYMHHCVAWSRRDIFFWNGVGSAEQTQLSRSLSGNVPTAAPDGDVDAYAEHLRRQPIRPPETLENAFLLALGDIMTDVVQWRAFDDFQSAANWIAQHDETVDQRLRVDGFEPVIPLGRTGSGDAEHERGRSVDLRGGLGRILKRIARRAYEPDDANDLVAAANQIFRASRVDVAGYFRDLLWRTRNDAVWFDRILGVSPDRAASLRWLESQGGLPVDGRGEELCLMRIDPRSWEALTPRSRYFLATALAMFERQPPGHAFDSAPISMEICKPLEVELARIFGDFRDAWIAEHGADPVPHVDPAERNDQHLVRLIKGQNLEIGPMSFLLRPRRKSSLLKRALEAFLSALPNADFLTSQELSNDLSRVTHNFRNGSVHDSALDASALSEAIDCVVGRRERPGLIARVVSAQVGDTGAVERAAPGPQWSSGVEFLELTVDYTAISQANAEALEPGDEEIGVNAQDAQIDVQTWQELLLLASKPELLFTGGDGILFETDSEIAIRLAPGLVAGVSTGALQFFYIHFDATLGNDFFLGGWDHKTVSGMSRALNRNRVDWMHRARLIGLFRRATSETLEMRFARNGPPGGYACITLDKARTGVLQDLLSRALEGRWGQLAGRPE